MSLWNDQNGTKPNINMATLNKNSNLPMFQVGSTNTTGGVARTNPGYFNKAKTFDLVRRLHLTHNFLQI